MSTAVTVKMDDVVILAASDLKAIAVLLVTLDLQVSPAGLVLSVLQAQQVQQVRLAARVVTVRLQHSASLRLEATSCLMELP